MIGILYLHQFINVLKVNLISQYCLAAMRAHTHLDCIQYNAVRLHHLVCKPAFAVFKLSALRPFFSDSDINRTCNSEKVKVALKRAVVSHWISLGPLSADTAS